MFNLPSRAAKRADLYEVEVRLKTETYNRDPLVSFVLYRRVSIEEQGRSGLGLDAQKRDIDLYLSTQEGAVLVADLVEVASRGK